MILADRLANRTNGMNYALASHEAMAGNLRIGDILDIGSGARIVRIERVCAPAWSGLPHGVVIYTDTAYGRKIINYDITDIVSVLV